MSELEEQIVKFIVAETHIKAKKVHLDSRFAQDIGMDGDDAIEFFEKFHEQFHVDLTELGSHWDQHFLPEGGGPSLACMVVIGIGAVVGGLLHETFKWIPVWVAMIVFVALLCWIYGKFFIEQQPEKTPITVHDLVEAANTRRWIKHYDSYVEPAPSMFRTLE